MKLLASTFTMAQYTDSSSPSATPAFIDSRCGLDKTQDGLMNEQQAWAMKYNARIASQQLITNQYHGQIAAIQGMISEYHAQPSATEDPQLRRNLLQTKQLLWATSIPNGAQVLGAEILHAKGWPKEAVAKQIQYQQPEQAATRFNVRARVRTKARAKVTPSLSTLTLSIRPKAPTITQDQTRQLVQFVQSSPSTRRMPIARLPAVLGLDCSERAVTVALGRQGYKSYPAMTRPRIDERTRQLRLNFAHQHLKWTVEQWTSVLFYDEMRVHLTEQPQEVFVTRKSDEDTHPDCVNIEPVAPTDCINSNVYFAHLSGLTGAGPLRSWTRYSDSNYGLVGPENWYRTIFHSFISWYNSHPIGSRFALSPDMPAYSGVTIKEALQASHKSIIHLPPASPDLNPITDIFATIKANLKADKANSLFGDVSEYRIDDVVRNTWEGVSQEYAGELIASMPKRCQAVIDADGWYTRF